MSLAPKLMTADEFLVWRMDQEGTWEFVDGVPRRKFANPLNMMAGGTQNHARVAANLIAALHPRLRGSACTALGSDLAVRNAQNRVRQPDVSVECGPFDGHDMSAREPRAVFEVLSPSTRRTDVAIKAGEYRQLPSLMHLIMLEADYPRLVVWTRDGAAWSDQEVIGMKSTLRLLHLRVELPFSEIYENVDLTPTVTG